MLNCNHVQLKKNLLDVIDTKCELSKYHIIRNIYSLYIAIRPDEHNDFYTCIIIMYKSVLAELQITFLEIEFFLKGFFFYWVITFCIG